LTYNNPINIINITSMGHVVKKKIKKF